jgi:transposase-like protein
MYTLEFRKEAVRKALLRGNRPFTAVAREIGVTTTSLKDWIEKSASPDGLMKKTKKNSPSKRTRAEKFKVLLEVTALAEAERGEYLRRHGLHSEELTQWQQEIELELKGPSKAERSDENKLRFDKTRLEKELRRKDKALAEASALLILKKKADLLFGTIDEEDEE